MTELTAEEKECIRNSLSKFAANLEENMACFYENFFTDYPQYHKMFYRVRDVPVSEIRTNPWIRNEQGPKVGSSVANLVSKMEDVPSLLESLHALVATPKHTKHNLTAEDYLNTFKNLLNTMKKCLGDDMSQADHDAWLKLAGILVPLIEAEIDKIPKE